MTEQLNPQELKLYELNYEVPQGAQEAGGFVFPHSLSTPKRSRTKVKHHNSIKANRKKYAQKVARRVNRRQ
jgi:hypothetical protein